jgi:hypothetical protein
MSQQAGQLLSYLEARESFWDQILAGTETKL